MTVAFHLKGDFPSREVETSLLWQAGCEGILEAGGELIAYFRAPVELALEGVWKPVEDVDWLAKYYESLKPVRVGRLIISPGHHQPEGEKVIWLDPGMAFGTGHHVTTRLALLALQTVDLNGKRVLDVGSGSGILAIAADLLGAAEAVGIDIDPETLAVAEENKARNRSKATFRRGTLDASLAAGSFEIVVANLYAELHARLAQDYARVLTTGGMLFATGILEERLEEVVTALEQFFSIQVQLEEGWALVSARRA